MRIAVVGATGKTGSRIVREALARGHHVTAISRHRGTPASHPNLTAVEADAADPAALARALSGSDAVVSAVRFVDSDPHKLIDALKRAGVKRWVVVGGAGSLLVASGTPLIDEPSFPAVARPEAGAGRDFLDVLRSERDLDWTFLSPSTAFAPGTRTGSFRLGDDRLLTAADGTSSISMEDYAIALLDELEHPAHVRKRFTVGY